MTFISLRFRAAAFVATLAVGMSCSGVFQSISQAAPLGTGVLSTAPDGELNDGRLPHLMTPSHAPITVSSATDLHRLFSRINYSLEDVSSGRRPVPGIFLNTLPGDLGDIQDSGTLKAVFIQAILPLVLKSNQEIRNDRLRLLTLRDTLQKGQRLQFLEQAWLDKIAAHYKVEDLSVDRRMEELLLRVDEIPPSLALAQAIEESGWGTSRSARKGNSLFGHTVFLPEGARIRSFASLSEGIDAYFHNLNTHHAYRDFRKERLSMRKQGLTPDSTKLIEKLLSYSERKQAYINTLRTLIRGNNLQDYDHAWLNLPMTGSQARDIRQSAALP